MKTKKEINKQINICLKRLGRLASLVRKKEAVGMSLTKIKKIKIALKKGQKKRPVKRLFCECISELKETINEVELSPKEILTQKRLERIKAKLQKYQSKWNLIKGCVDKGNNGIHQFFHQGEPPPPNTYHLNHPFRRPISGKRSF